MRILGRPIAFTVPAVAAALLISGVVALNDYMSAPGAVGETPDAWPSGTGIERTPERWTIVLAAHPKCPCTRATAEQMIGPLRGSPEADLVILSYVSPERADSPPEPGVAGRLAELPNARVVADPGARLAERFGAVTSGHVVAFAPDGSTAFSGGVTRSRGMSGPATGLASLHALLSDSTPPAAEACVYGCPLVGPAEGRASVDLSAGDQR